MRTVTSESISGKSGRITHSEDAQLNRYFVCKIGVVKIWNDETETLRR